ncbi:MAG: PIN domain-containing protein [Acidobacteriia bacterium]|nr:PIN domain-containing protein [Terriglobia bacterium]
MKTRVLDSWAILEWMNGRQPASVLVDKLFSDSEQGRGALLMSAINVGETYYFLRKKHSEPLAESWRRSSQTFPLTIHVPSAQDIWNAAVLKAQFPISYADAFAAALALEHEWPLVTGDPEFRSVARLKLEWIGPQNAPKKIR